MQSLTQNILHKVVLWAERHSSEIIRFGSKLNAEEISIARAAGVAHPDQIRIMFVEQIPCPDDPELLELIIKYDLFGTNTAGLTIGYGVYW